jgi:hypothetical protein
VTHKTELIFQRLRNVLGSPPNVRRIFITVRAPSVTRTDIAVLRVLLSEMNQRGIYITVDRPEKHVLEILERQNLATHAEVSFVAGPPPRRIVIATGVFSPAAFIDELFLRLADPRTRPGLHQELADMKFMIVDNLSSLAAYNGPAGIAACFGRISQFLNAYPSIRFVAVAARDSFAAVRPGALGFLDMEVDIPDDWFAA